MIFLGGRWDILNFKFLNFYFFYSMVQYSTVQYSTVQYSTVQYSTQYSSRSRMYSSFSSSFSFSRLEVGKKRKRRRRRKCPSEDPRSSRRGPWVKTIPEGLGVLLPPPIITQHHALLRLLQIDTCVGGKLYKSCTKHNVETSLILEI